MDALLRDLRFAARRLGRAPAASLVAIGSLALAIGGNVTVFATLNGLLYRPLPFPEPERVLVLGERAAETRRGFRFGPTSAANFLDWSRAQSSFSTLAAYRTFEVSLANPGEGAAPVKAAAVSPEFFTVLGAEPVVGRTFGDDATVPGNHRAVVLAHDLWQEQLAGRREAVGETLTIDGEVHDVLGVLPPRFEFLDPAVELYVPFVSQSASLDHHRRDLLVVGRLGPESSGAAAEAEIRALTARLAEAHPEALRGIEVDALNLRHELPLARDRRLYLLVQGALFFVLLIACANLANLLLAQSQAREREMALRASLGAGRARIVRQLFTESLVTAAAGGAAGLALGAAGIRAMERTLAALVPRSYAPAVDHRVVLFTVAVSLGAGGLFALAPVVHSWRLDLVASLKEGSSTSGRRRLAHLLVVGELALALTFLAGAGMLLGSFEAMRAADPGFDVERLLSVRLTLPQERYGQGEALALSATQIRERLEALPGVLGVAVSDRPPRGRVGPRVAVTVTGRGEEPGAAPRVAWRGVAPGYFEALDIPLRQGRDFTDADRAGAAPVVIVNEAMARRYWGEASPLGERVELLGGIFEVAGVVATVRHGLGIGDELAPAVYLPWARQPGDDLALALAASASPSSLVPAVRGALSDLDPAFAGARIEPLADHVEQFYVAPRIFSAVLGGFGFLALLLAALGTYGVLAYTVERRRREIGVRMAMGADRRRVTLLVVSRGLVLAAWGVGLAVPGTFVVTRLLAGLLAGALPVDPARVAVAAAVLVAATMAASLVPARRAASVDPIAALRYE